MRGAALFAFIALFAAGRAAAEPLTLSAVDLSNQRGGLMIPGLGLDIGFAASVRTFVDGRLALETKLSWSEQGVVTERSGDLASPNAGGPDLTRFWGVSPSLSGGSTQVLQDLSNGRIASVILNTANDRTIRQDTDIVLTLPQLPALQQQFGADRISSTLQAAVGAELQSSARGR